MHRVRLASMRVKKAGGRVFGADLTAAEKRAMQIEINRQIAESDRQHANDIDAMVLYVLHTHLGFGKKRLRRFYEAFIVEYNKLIEHYEMPDSGAWLADVMLKQTGVDVAAWNAEQEGVTQ